MGERIMRWIIYRMIRWIVAQSAGIGGSHIVANRYTRTLVFDKLEVAITLKDTSQPNGYCREELYEMLWTIRDEERKQNWKVPEPA